MLGLYWKRAQAIPLLLGMAAGLAAILAMYIHEQNTAFWGTKFAVAESEAPKMAMTTLTYNATIADSISQRLEPTTLGLGLVWLSELVCKLGSVLD